MSRPSLAHRLAGALLCLVGLGSIGGTASADAEPRLSLGEDRRYTLGTGETLGLELAVPPSTTGYARLRVQQIASDVIVRLHSATGEHLADQPLGTHQPEILVVTAAPYRLDIRARSPGEIRVEWAAADPGGDRFPGDLAWTAATHLVAEDSEGSLAAAVPLLNQAAQAYAEAGLGAAEGRALFVAGHLASDVGDLDGGLELARRAVERRKDAGDAAGLVDSWHLVGHIHRLAGRSEDAKQALEESLALARQLGDARAEARALLNLGFVAQQSADFATARTHYRSALLRLEATEDVPLRSKLLNNLAGLAYQSGQLREAAARFEELRRLELGVADPRAEARTLINLGSARRELGRYQESLEAYDAALDVLQGVGEPRLEASVLNNLGFTYLTFGDIPRAVDRLEDALGRRRAAEDRRAVATTLNNLGRAARAMGDWDRAASFFDEASTLRESIDDPRGQARALHELGQLELARGRPGAARDPLEWALLARREFDDVLGEAESAAALARAYLELGLGDEALEQASGAVAAFGRLGSQGGEARARLVRLRIHRRRGALPLARRDAERALELVESLRFEVESPELRGALLGVVREVYEEAVDLWVAQGDWRGAFAIAERARARALLDVLQGAGDAHVPEAHREEHRRLVEDLAGLRYRLHRQRRRGRPPDDADVAAWRELTLSIDRLQHAGRGGIDGGPPLRLGESGPGESGPGGDGPLTLDDFQGALDRDTRALVYFLGRRRSFLWQIDADSASLHRLPARRDIELQAAEMLDSVSVFDPRGLDAVHTEAAEVARVLVAPAIQGPKTPERLVLVPDGALLRLPFAVLPADGQALLERFEIVHLPSASALPALRLRGRGSRDARGAPATADMALIADPLYAGSELARLDGSRREADGLRALDGITVDAHLGAGARRSAVLGDALRPYRYVHFATHATFDGERPELSALALSLADAEGRPLDGYLRLTDIVSMSLGAELVVLSGCDTGLGRDVDGEGLQSLARAFFYAGSARVASTLWRVDDDATAELMTRFYRHLLQDDLTPTAALRRAQLELRRDRRYRHPFFWAAFFIQGDWRVQTEPAPR